MINSLVTCSLAGLLAHALASDQVCDGTHDHQSCDESSEEVALLAQRPVLKELGERRLEVDTGAEDGFCCWYSASASCSNCHSASSPTGCGGHGCDQSSCPGSPSVGGSFWCPTSPPPSPTPMPPSPTPLPPSPTPSPSPSESLEACLRGAGGSPWTYFPGEYEGNSNLKDVHNARLNPSIQPRAVVFAKEESNVILAAKCADKFLFPVYGRSGMNQYEASCAGVGGSCIIVDTNNLDQLVWPSRGCQNGQAGCVAELGPGLSLGLAYSKLSERSYTIPAGTCAQVRVAGLTLGGGKGWLTRKHGLLSDTLSAIDAVLLNGTKVHASLAVNPHLFWLARGAGGNIFPGVVTAFWFALAPMPQSPATFTMTWHWDRLSQVCRAKVMALWYEKLATDSDLDLWSRLTLKNFGDGQKLVLDVIYYGSDKNSAEQKLRSVATSANCGTDYTFNSDYNDDWIQIVLRGNGLSQASDLSGNNCGWELRQGQKPVHTQQCSGFDKEYNVKWAYRSLVFGKGGVVPQGVWDTLAQQNFSQVNTYIEVDPTNGVTANIPSDATAYPYRDAGYVTLQQVMRDVTNPLDGQLQTSATMMKRLTEFVPSASYYNYLDKSMNQYGAVPRDAYYSTNADTVEAFLRQYTEDVNPNGCVRCDSWELAAR